MNILTLGILLSGVFFALLTGCETERKESEIDKKKTITGVQSVDPVKISPDIYRILVDNDYVRVIENRANPGQKDFMHSHPAGVWYTLKGAKLKLYTPDGMIRSVELKPGAVNFQDPIPMHAMENIGDKAMELIIVELKDKKPAGTTGPDAVMVSPDIYRVMAENEKIRVLELTLEPGAKDEPHGHPGSVFYVIRDSTGKIFTEGEEPKLLRLKAGNAWFQEPVNQSRLENTGETSIHMILFEIKPGQEQIKK
ncbi:MAG: hypothetical protein V3R54_01585 [Thermodesulfovibrionia bacterium]